MTTGTEIISTEILKRFFSAIDLLVDSGEMTGLQSFCNTYNLNRARYSKLRAGVKEGRDAQYKSIEVVAIAYLCRDFGISTDWILLGQGTPKGR